VVYFFEVGLLLVVVPWSTYWDRNYFARLAPAIGDAIRNPYVRGAVSGLGLINIVAGLAELFTLFSSRWRWDKLRPTTHG
jgi:hypothetical protein